MKAQRINLGELLKGNKEGFFRSKGFTKIKVTKNEKQGKEMVAVEHLYEFEIKAVGNNPLIKEFNEKYPEPIAPATKELINQLTGATIQEAKISPEKIADFPEFKWCEVFDRTDKNFVKELGERNNKLRILWIMIAFSQEEEYGLDKIDEFEKDLEKQGLTANHINKIGADINDLDFFTEKG